MNKDISVPIYVESRYRVNRKKIKERVVHTLRSNGVTSPMEVSVAIVGNRKMRSLNKRYRDIAAPTNVLSFSQGEGDYMPHSGEVTHLGDVVISYPVVIDEASRYNRLIDDWVCDLVEHGVTHLLGVHHK